MPWCSLMARTAPLVVVLLAEPELGLLLHNVGQHRASEEHHVLPARRVLDLELELARSALIAFGHALDPQLAHVLLQPTRQPREHRRTSAQHNVLKELGAQIPM